jgi:hypothetical protein
VLIEIDASAIDDAVAGTAMSRECIENLLRGHRAGRHVVCLDPEQLRRLEPIAEAFSLQARNALAHIRWQRNEIRGLRDRVRWMMRLGLGPAFGGAVVAQAGKEIIHAGLHHFHDDERAGRAVVLGENLTDTGLYVALGRAYTAAVRWRAEASFEERLGGGDTTAMVFRQLVADGRIVLAIADADQTHPGGPIGGTAARLLPIARIALQYVHVLHVRTAENVITSAVYREAFRDPPARPDLRAWAVNQDALPRLMHAETLPSAHPWRDHADLKDGVGLAHVQAMNAGPEQAFWLGVAIDLGRDHCRNPPACAALPACGCYVTDALGRHALALAVAWLKLRDGPRDLQRNARLLGLAPGTPLGELCERVLAWGLALSVRPA